MAIQRFSSRRHRLYDAFLGKRLPGAASYDRIAGYFQSSLLALAAEELKAITRVRIVCNTEVNPADVHAVRQATGPRQRELQDALLRMIWNAGNFPHLVDVYGEQAKKRLRLHLRFRKSSPGHYTTDQKGVHVVDSSKHFSNGAWAVPFSRV